MLHYLVKVLAHADQFNRADHVYMGVASGGKEAVNLFPTCMHGQ